MGFTHMLQLMFSFLQVWLNNEKLSMAFVMPVVWREPTNYTDGCFFRLIRPIKAGLLMKKPRTVQYPNL